MGCFTLLIYPKFEDYVFVCLMSNDAFGVCGVAFAMHSLSEKKPYTGSLTADVFELVERT